MIGAATGVVGSKYYEDSPIGLQLVEITSVSKCQNPRSNYVPRNYSRSSTSSSPRRRLIASSSTSEIRCMYASVVDRSACPASF